jgi:predicted nucleic acid-binding Zn ribbon protein
MRKRDAQSLGEILKESLHSLKIDGKIQETRLLEAWPEIVGSLVATHTLGTNISKKILYVKLDSPLLRSELQMMRQNLIDRLNVASGGDTIKEIIFR